MEKETDYRGQEKTEEVEFGHFAGSMVVARPCELHGRQESHQNLGVVAMLLSSTMACCSQGLQGTGYCLRYLGHIGLACHSHHDQHCPADESPYLGCEDLSHQPCRRDDCCESKESLRTQDLELLLAVEAVAEGK